MLHQLLYQNKYKNNRGYVALMSVLIISAVGLIIAVSLLSLGISYQRSNSTLEQGYNAKSLAQACSSVSLNKIRLDESYLGDESISFGTNHCNILSVSQDGIIYTIYTEGIVKNISHKNKIVVIRNEDEDTKIVNLDIESWQDVVEF